MDDDKKKKEKPEEGKEFPIREFPDLRCLRKAYLRKDGKPVQVDSTDNPLHDAAEEDFGLQRSSEEEAWKFLCDTLDEAESCDVKPDELTEFLDDE